MQINDLLILGNGAAKQAFDNQSLIRRQVISLASDACTCWGLARPFHDFKLSRVPALVAFFCDRAGTLTFPIPLDNQDSVPILSITG